MKKEIQKNKSHILPFAKDNLDTWKLIKKGKKKIETRAGGPKYIGIQPGDTLIFSCLGKKFNKKVLEVTHFKTIKSMLKKYNPSDINPTIKTAKELQEMYDSFTGYKERLKEFGILAFVLE
jgi:ASC-1-like (ASCH) protein